MAKKSPKFLNKTVKNSIDNFHKASKHIQDTIDNLNEAALRNQKTLEEIRARNKQTTDFYKRHFKNHNYSIEEKSKQLLKDYTVIMLEDCNEIIFKMN